MEPAIDHPAVQVLLSFFNEMNAWENEMSRYVSSIDRSNTSQEKQARDMAIHRKQLEEVYEKYCEVGARAERLQDLGLSFSRGLATHDPEREKIVSVSVTPGRVIVETKESAATGGWGYKYEIVEKDGAWRVRDNRERNSEKNPNWREDML
jgi:hypothetical protein